MNARRERALGLLRAGIAATLLGVLTLSAQTPSTPPGAGTAEDPYLISSLGHLLWMAGTAATSAGRCYALTADIDAAETAGWNDPGTDETLLEGFAPIGTAMEAFAGEFDGRGHTVSNLTIARPETECVGLFGCLGGAGLIARVRVDGSAVTGLGTAGGLVGYNTGGTVTECHSTAAVAGLWNVGGLVGYSEGGALEFCTAAGTATGEQSVGGLLGSSSSSTVAGCNAAGMVTGYWSVGGLLGGGYDSLVTQCTAAATVIGSDGVGGMAGSSEASTVMSCTAASTVAGETRVGGLLGWNQRSAVADCVAAGAVTGRADCGGLVGESADGVIVRSGATATVTNRGSEGVTGGLVGRNYGYDDEGTDDADTGVVVQCYAAGAVTGSGDATGGLIGHNGGGPVRQCYASGPVRCAWGAIGGLIGRNEGSVAECYARGAVAGGADSTLGGLVADNWGVVEQSYWDLEASGQSGSAGGSGRSTARMRQQITYPGWNFGGVWGIVEEFSYPYLLWEPNPFTLAVVVVGPGTVTRDPDLPSYEPGATVTLRALPADTGAEFVGWQGAVSTATAAETTVTVAGRTSVAAQFRTVRGISSLEELQRIGRDAGYTLDGRYWLSQDIDATASATWNDPGTDDTFLEGFAPIGTAQDPFTGEFDGRGHVITGLTINRSDSAAAAGLFGQVGSTGAIWHLGLAGGTVSGPEFVGPLAGTNWGTVEQCWSTAAAAGMYYVGGLVGYSEGGSALRQCYARGPVNGMYYVGGLVGADWSTVEECYAAGAVTGTSGTGGLVGAGWYEMVTRSYWDIDASGQGSSAGGEGRSTAQMCRQATFADWDFAGTWHIVEDIDYPALAWGPYALLTAVVGSGTVAVEPAQAAYELGAVVSLRAIAGEGGEFARWEGPVATADAAETTVVINRRTTVTAVFRTARGLSTIAEVQRLGNDPAYPLDGHYWLTGNIDGTETAGWNDLVKADGGPEGFLPIGSEEEPFRGQFDGQGYAIVGLTINRPGTYGVGLFGVIGSGAVVCNLTLDGGTVVGGDGVGALAGWSYGTVVACHSTAAVAGNGAVGGLLGGCRGYWDEERECRLPFAVSGCRGAGAVTGSWGVGGLIGCGDFGTLELCTAAGAVTGEEAVGGLIGRCATGEAKGKDTGFAVTGCHAKGTVSGLWAVGGLIGGCGPATLQQCTAAGAVSGDSGVGGLVGSIYGLVKADAGATLEGCQSTGTVTGLEAVGGLVGRGGWAMLAECSAAGPVTGEQAVGGLMGAQESDAILQCWATGAVTGFWNVGGLVGYSYGDGSRDEWDGGEEAAAVVQCYATGGVSGTWGVGGLIGYNGGEYDGWEDLWYGCTVKQCYATGAVTGSEGGAGGLVGCNEGRVRECYAVGAVTGDDSWEDGVGGLVGENRGTVELSYWDTETSGQESSEGGQGRTTARMRQQATYVGWNFGDVWQIAEGLSYPCFASGSYPFTLAVTVIGPGRVVRSPEQAAYLPGTVVVLTAVADADGLFVGWQGVGGAVTTEPEITVTVASHLSFVAQFRGVRGVSSIEDMQRIGRDPDYPLDGCYRLTQNIDASATATWDDPEKADGVLEGFLPIGSEEYPFTGLFDGQGFTITGLTINRPDAGCVGFFGVIGTGAVVRNLGLDGGSVRGAACVGALAGWSAGTVTQCWSTAGVTGDWDAGGLIGRCACGTLERCTAAGIVRGGEGVGGLIGGCSGWSDAAEEELGFLVTECQATSTVAGLCSVGGLIGYGNMGTLELCLAGGPVSGEESVGGLIGYGGSVTLVLCSAAGAVTGNGSVGGLVGCGESSSVLQCLAAGAVTGGYSVGGLIGTNSGWYDDWEGVWYGEVTQCYASGAVTGSEGGTGGLAGRNSGGQLVQCYATGAVTGSAGTTGGLVGLNEGTIAECYAVGAVAGGEESTLGGLVAENWGSVEQCYWDTETSGQGRSAGGVGRSTAPMQRQHTYAGWDFGAVWGIAENRCYPYLRWDPYPFSIAVTVVGPGTVTLDPSLPSYEPGAIVTLRATPGPGAEFVCWQGGATAAAATATEIAVTVSTHWSVVARFRTVCGISSLEELQRIGYDPSYTLDGRYWLTQDIDATATATWNDPGTDTAVLEGFAPIGTAQSPFTGEFDGWGHAIVGLTLNRAGTECLGLFSALGPAGAIRHVGLDGGAVTGAGCVGSLVAANRGTIEQCWSTAAVTGTYDVGGLVGASDSEAAIRQCYARGQVNGVYYAGGLVGENWSTLEECYAAGPVAAFYSPGGLVGAGWANLTPPSYWDVEVSGQGGSAGGEGRSTAQMCRQATFVGWDFAGTWSIAEGVDYPTLAWGPYILQTEVVGAGTVAVEPAQESYALGTVVTLRAVAGAGAAFLRWEGPVAEPDAAETTVVIRRRTTVVAVFGIARGLSTIAELQRLGNDPDYPLDGHYWLTQDIDATETALWDDPTKADGTPEGFLPIGSAESPFSGQFDGQGYAITGLTINRPWAYGVGLFVAIAPEAVVRNLTLDGGSVTGGDNVGALAAWNAGTVVECHSTALVAGSSAVGGLLGCNQSGTVAQCSGAGTTRGGNAVGALIGLSGAGVVTGCSASGRTAGEESVGGLIGSCTTWLKDGAASTVVTGCQATGDVSGSHAVGGLIGDCGGTAVENCAAASTVNGDDAVGALVGFCHESTVTDCRAEGTTVGRCSVGGLVGYCAGEDWESPAMLSACSANGATMGADTVGGLVGLNEGAGILECYAAGPVTALWLGDWSGTRAGGLIAYNTGWVAACYAIGDVTGYRHVGGLIGTNDTVAVQCYSAGAVAGISNVGGLVGSGFGEAIDCYWDTEASGWEVSAGGSGRTTAQMHARDTYEDWDFESIWGIWPDLNSGYPYLEGLRNRSATVFLTNLTVTYDGLGHTPTVATDPAGLPVAITYNGGTTVPIAAGNYTVTVEVMDLSYAATTTATLTINPAVLTCTADDQVMEYLGAVPGLTIRYSGLAGSDTAPAVPPHAACAATPSSPPGAYPITLTGGSDPNYLIALVPGTLTIRDSSAPGAPSVSGVTPAHTTTPTWTWMSGGGDGTGTFRYQLGTTAGTWNETTTLSFTPATPLGEGTHTLYVQERDATGNWSPTGSHAIAVDAFCTISFAGDGPGSLSGELVQVVPYGGATTAVRAEADPGYAFAGWSDGLVSNPRIMRGVTADLDLMASFRSVAVPDGEFAADVSGAAVVAGDGWWDFSGTYATAVEGRPLEMALLHDTRGRLTGTATYTVGKSASVRLLVRGNVRSGGGSVVAAVVLRGTDRARGIRVLLTMNLALNPSTRQLAGPVAGTITVEGLRSPVAETVALAVPAPMDGTWTLWTDLAQEPGGEVTGVGELELSNGVVLALVTVGTPAGEAVELILSGAPDDPSAEGIAIRATMVPLTGGEARLQAIRGSGYGQTVVW